MKQVFILIPALLLLVSCSPKDDLTKSAIDLTIPKTNDEQTFSIDAGPGIVNVYFGSDTGKTPTMPSALIFSFLPSNNSVYLKTHPVSWLRFEGGVSKNNQRLSFGCDGYSQSSTLPELIEADEVSICGKILFSGTQLNIVANHIILNHAEIEVRTDGNEDNTIDPINVLTNELEFLGENSLTAKTKTVSFSPPPPISYTIGKITGSGSLHTISFSNTVTRKIK